MRRIAWLALLNTLLIASMSHAQKHDNPVIIGGAATLGRPWFSPPGYFGPGPAIGAYSPAPYGTDWGYYGVNGGPYIGPGVGAGLYRGFGPFPWNFGIPGAAGSFWTNGRSLYGPPVPIYGPTPGVFGGGDDNKRFFGNPPPANSVWVGLGWHGYRSPSPRRLTPTVSVYPSTGIVPAPSVQIVEAVPVTTPEGQPCIKLHVLVPDADAEIWISTTETKQKGTERIFESPPLEAGMSYKYELIAKWKDNGQEKAESRTVLGQAGQTIMIDFSKPAEAAAR
jgi:uncharacterized protein (TIGR03000 family)